MKTYARSLVLAAIGLGLQTLPASAQTVDECLMCHARGAAERDGRSLELDRELFEASVHGTLDCIACHWQLEGVEGYPHETELERVACDDCHDDDDGPIAEFRASAHGRLAAKEGAGAPLCQDCHGNHGIRPLAEQHGEDSALHASCAGCHAEIVQRNGLSTHLGVGVACKDCHGGHGTTSYHDADLAVSTGKINALCTGCHSDVVAAQRDSIHAAAFTGRSCLACHEAHRPRRPEPILADQNCLMCHESDEPDEPDDLGGPPGPAPASAVAESIHGAAAVACVLCHADLKDAGDLDHEEVAPVDCSHCHPKAGELHAIGVHATAVNGGPAAKCTDCHGAHDVRAALDPRSRVFPRNQPATCEACHHPSPSPEHPAPAGKRVKEYEGSIHGRLLLDKGLVVSATCSSCHGAHEIGHAGDDEAATSRRNVPYTCGACHAGMLEGYLAGFHGAEFLTGVEDVPVCTDCHAEHAIQDPAMAESTVGHDLVAATCAACHADDALANLYGFDSGALASWGRSYHGVATALGERSAANCASCHGHHEILPSTDPRSRVHPDNLEATCGACHAGASAAFAGIPVHSVIDRATNPVPWWVRTIYAWLIGMVIGAFLLFILFDLFGRVRLRMGWGPPETEHVDPARWSDEGELVAPGETFERMTRHARTQHMILIASFVLLVLTGLPLFLYDFEWMRSTIDLEGRFRVRSLLHRAGAVGLIGLSVWHLAVLALSRDARRWFAKMMLRPRDVFDFLKESMFDLGLMSWLSRRRLLRPLFARFPALRCDKRPAMGRYGLVEKIEYGAVLWGNLVMVATGFILWRPGWFLGWTPGWTWDVCRVVHGFEATLAFLAIIIWHMYHVHLRPGAFPMSKVWLNGRITREELRHHHPLEYVRILERRRARGGTRKDSDEFEETLVPHASQEPRSTRR